MAIDRDESLPSTVPVSLSQSDSVSEDLRMLERQDAVMFWGRARTAPAQTLARHANAERNLLRKSR